MQKFVFPMRETMPFFVSSLRAVDDWKRANAKRADAITQAEYDANAKYVKSAFARSLRIEDLLRFLDDTVLDINFMVQLPSIEKCLEKWWKLYARGKRAIDQDILREVYYDLAFVLVEAKTETMHKNSVSMILRSSWTKWSPKEPPLGKSEFFRLLFILAHLMTTTERLGDYVIFFDETMAKIARHYQNKQARTQQRTRRPRMRLKSSVSDILNKEGSSSRSSVSSRGRGRLPTTMSGSSSNQRLNVQMGHVPTQAEVSSLSEEEDDDAGNCFTELLDRGNSRCQYVVVDPLLHERSFQEKWKRPNGNASSTNVAIAAQNPATNKYFPPLLASRVRTNPPVVPPKAPVLYLPSSGQTMHSGQQFKTSSPPPVPSEQPLNQFVSSQSALPSTGDTLSHPFNGTASPTPTPSNGHRLTDMAWRSPLASSGPSMNQSRSTPSILIRGGGRKVMNDGNAVNASTSLDSAFSGHEEELLRRSLSKVTLKKRVDQNKADGDKRLKSNGQLPPSSASERRQKGAELTKPIYLAIST